MSTVLLTDADLARRLALLGDGGRPDVEKLHVLRRRYGWPCVKLSRRDVRFTEQQAEQIIASRTVSQRKPKKDDAPAGGLTKRSAGAS
jgi:hypothetical protein